MLIAGLRALTLRSVESMSASTSQLAEHGSGGVAVELARQSAQQRPSHFSTMTSRILLSISRLAAGRGAVVPPK